MDLGCEGVTGGLRIEDFLDTPFEELGDRKCER
jgi:hypothetical protein